MTEERPTASYLGTEGSVYPGLHRGLPDHLDGIPVAGVHAFTLPRWHSWSGGPLPMIELREDGDAGGQVAARWPEPFPDHALDGAS